MKYAFLTKWISILEKLKTFKNVKVPSRMENGENMILVSYAYFILGFNYNLRKKKN